MIVLQPLAMEALVVTSQKRAQSIQEVPIAITAWEGAFLEEVNVQEFDSFASFVPGLEVQIQSPNNPGFVVRGITSDSGDSRIEPRVSVFQDGVSISKSRGSVVELFDMERIEVLKGPQGTLFGRGAQIGAVHLIQRKPTPNTEGEITVGTGSFDERFVRGFVNTPLVEDRLALRVSGILTQRDGFIDNLSGGNLNGKDVAAVRASLRWTPSSRTTVDAIANHQVDNPPGTSFKSGTYAPAGGSLEPWAFADMERGDDLFLDRTVSGLTLLVDHRLTDELELQSISGLRRFDSYESFDADGTAAPVLWFAEDAEGDQFSQELRLSFQGEGRFQGFVGTSYFWEDGSQRVPWETDERSLFVLFSPLLAAGGAPVSPIPLVGPDGSPNLPLETNPLTGLPFKQSHTETFTNFGQVHALEAFADGTLALTDRLDLTAGIRGTLEWVDAAYEVEGDATPGTLGFILGATPNNLFAPTDGRETAEASFQAVTGRVSMDYEVSEALNLFANVARGRRPPVLNVTAGAVDTLDAEIVWSYEAGLKSSLQEGRIVFDANAFRYDYTNFQTNVATLEDGAEAIFRPEDSGAATALGFETSVQVGVSDNLSLFGNYGWVDATFDDTDVDGQPQELAGNTFRLTPEHSFSVGGQASVPVGGLGRVFVTPSYTWKSEVFFEETNLPEIRQDAYGLLNVQAGLAFADERYEITVWGRNLLDEEYIIDAGNTGGGFGIPTFIAGPPRFLGVRLTARF
jgi:outer membrane receptor protein involved in Fe transport